MGTSSMYNGYSDSGNPRNPLLPDDFDDNSENPENNPESDKDQNDNPKEEKPKDNTNWQAVKNAMSRLASGSSSDISGVVSKYVRAHGGGKSASKNAISGISTTVNLGNFLSNASTVGLKETLQSYKIDYENKSLSEVLNNLINFLAPSPVTKEESIARKALIITMEKLYELIENENANIELIEKLNSSSLNQIIPLYVESYIYERLINDLGSRIEENSIDSNNAIKLEKELKEYITSKVEIAFRGKDLSTTSFDKKEVESLYNQCYNVMEDLV
ncbi:MAG TPA: Qat anti-phage system associated protein QatB [Flavobacterium sp.]|uniref:Qat anti-phage system associated protein QatB n=1 Tax=Flavobacterium sp. TaxID=239 RepID=UPI002ED2F862